VGSGAGVAEMAEDGGAALGQQPDGGGSGRGGVAGRDGRDHRAAAGHVTPFVKHEPVHDRLHRLVGAAQRVERQAVADVARAVHDKVPKVGVDAGQAGRVIVVGRGQAGDELVQLVEQRRRHPRGAQRGRVGADRGAHLHHRANDVDVDGAVVTQKQTGEHVEAGAAPVVADPGGAPVPDLDQAELIEPLERLPKRLPVDPELLGQGPLRRQGGAGRQPPVEDLRRYLIEHRRRHRCTPHRRELSHADKCGGKEITWSSGQTT